MIDLNDLRSTPEATGRAAAEGFRAEHRLDLGPIKDVIDLVQDTANADVTLMDLPEGIESVMYSDEEAHAVLIAVGTNDNPERQRFSIAHELGHWVLQEMTAHTETTLDRQAEQRAHSFARHLLLPVEAVRSHIGHRTVTERAISDLVALFEVSGTVAAIQLYNAQLIDEPQFRALEFLDAGYLARRYGWSAERNARVIESNAQRPPQRMLANATEAYVNHFLSIETLAHIDGSATAADLKAALDAAGVHPRTIDVAPVDYDDFGDSD